MATMLETLMLISLLLFCYVSSSSSFFAIQNYAACRPDQIQALTQFTNEFDSSSCNQTDPFNEVLCDNSTGAVTKLQLEACLSGTLKANSSLFKLHHLRYLNLSNNNFISSSLPSEFGNLNKLEVLSLSSNGFIGQVPSSFSNLSLLYSLDLARNALTGSFSHVQNLTKLSSLRLSYNDFSGSLSPFCELHQLTDLKLGYNNFNSSIPYEIGNLNKLEILSLASNNFFGQVPSTFSNLTLLTKLSLGQNKFTGSLSLVQNLTKLTFLDLSYNHFTGTIFSLDSMPFLSELSLSGNSLVGSIEFQNSSRLERMYLEHNPFDGKILEPISKLINLTHLDISYLNVSQPVDLNLFSSIKSLFFLDISGNNISPTSLSSDSDKPLNVKVLYLSECGITELPNILKTVKNLTSLRLSHNEMKGKVPKWLWSIPRLNSVNIGNNSFNGFEEGSEDTLVNSSVQLLFINDNNFQGALPNLPLSIKVLDAGSNNFSGEIPLSICKRFSLDVIDLRNNNFTGSIPQCFGNLLSVDLRKNNLQGSVPDAFCLDSSSLRRLDVGFNQITGKLPRSLLNCSSLRVLIMDHNKMKDTFPFWLKALPNLQVLILRSNQFYGPISPPNQNSLGFPELRIFELSDNNFSGSLPPGYFLNWKAPSLAVNENGGLYMVYEKDLSALLGYYYTDFIDLQYKGLSMEQEKVLTSYAAIDFSGNRIQGQIPESIGILKGLIALNLSNNAFTGHIPLSLENVTQLESLDLSRNQLSGNIPNALSTLSFLAVINVSHNQLSGRIPQGPQFTGQPKSSFEGNAQLCGLPLEERCGGTITPPEQQLEEEDEKDIIKWKAVTIGYGFGVIFGVAIAQMIFSYKLEWLTKIVGLTHSVGSNIIRISRQKFKT